MNMLTLRLAPLRVLAFLAGSALLGLPATAQKPPAIVTAHMVLASDAVLAGSSVKAIVEAEIAAGYHINDHKPSLDYLIPTVLKLEPSKQVEPGEVSYPKGSLEKLAFSDSPLSVYQGKLVLEAELKVPRGTPAGTYPVKGKLTYQGCNDRACFPPQSIPLEVTLKVTGTGTRMRPAGTASAAALAYSLGPGPAY